MVCNFTANKGKMLRIYISHKLILQSSEYKNITKNGVKRLPPFIKAI